MAKGKDVRVTLILECTSCARNNVNRVSTGIFRYITQKNWHNTPNRLELKKILSPLLQAYDSWGDKEIDLTEYLYITLSRKGKK